MSTKRVLYFDEAAHAAELRTLDEAAGVLQPLLDEALRLNVVSINNIGDLVALAEKGDAQIKDLIANEIERPKIGRFLMRKKSVIEDLELPDFSQLNIIAETCRRTMPHGSYIYKCLTISSGKVIVSPFEAEQLKDGYTVYADTKEKERLLTAATDAAAAFEQLRKSLQAFELPIMPESRIDNYFTEKDGKMMFNNYFFQRNSFRISE